MPAATPSQHPKTIGEIARERARDPKPPAPPGKQRDEEIEPDRELWRQARQDKLAVTVTLRNGETIRGLVRGYGRYSVCLVTDQGPVVVFKTAMATAIAGEPRT